MSKIIAISTISGFDRSAKKLMGKQDLIAFKKYILQTPKAGEVMSGTGGIRKIRWAVGGRGKSGGVRIIYFFVTEAASIYLLQIYTKSTKANLTNAEMNEYKKIYSRDQAITQEKAMSEFGQSLLESLKEAAAHAEGKPSGVTTEYFQVPDKVDVKAIRMATGATQEQFAKTYGFKVTALRSWEQGRRRPGQSSRILLKIIEKRPDLIHEVFTVQ
jgi:DNA-binding transcriptional regulator YiaG/mRNA-degrading endonuclease RelE of RelBE toxin-antitoxin system